jgi:AMIN domain
MRSSPRSIASRLLTVVLGTTLFAWGFLAQTLLAQSSVRQVKVMDSRGAVEIEVEASDRIVPQTQMLTGPDRLVIDFPNSVPGKQLFSQSVNKGEVKDVRIGLFQSKPPITRLVLDLKTAQSYQIFPYGRTVMIKVIGTAPAEASAAVQSFPASSPTRPGLVNANYTAGAERLPVNTQPKPCEVIFRDGLLTIKANKATFSEVLFAVQQRTGADIAIPAGAEQERVVADIGPGPVQEVLASLLNGSNFNFLILNSANDPRKLDRVILSPRNGGVFVPASGPPPIEDASNEEPAPEAEVRPPQPVAVAAPPPQHADVPPTSPPEEDAPSNQ